ncbi:CHASE domain-containing protein [Phormidesmis sp. 146-35]
MAFDRPQRRWLPSFILMGTLLLTAIYSYYAFITARAKDQLRFENAVQQTQSKIENQLETYTALLRASSGLFVASTSVSRQDFQTYVDRLDLRRRYPGIQGIGYSARVLPDQLPDLIAEMQNQGLENFAVRPTFPRSEYHAILYLEPSDVRNQAAIGFDMFTDATRRMAMEKARDTGNPAASGRVTLIQEIDAQKQAGFLIYMPIYQGGRVPGTVEDRRAALQGFVYSPFRADDLLGSIFGDESQLLVDFQVYDGSEVRADKLLHAPPRDYSSNTFQTVRRITIAGEPWTLVFFPRPELEIDSEMRRVPYILIGSALASFILFLLVQSQIRARQFAERTAFDLQRSQSALRQTESRLRRLMDANIIGIIIANVNGEVLEANDAFLNMIGYSREEAMTGAINWRDITPPEYFPLDDRAREEMQERGSHDPYEKAYLRRDGTRVPVVVGTALLEDGNLGIGFLLDITERVRVEDDRKRAEEALQRTNDRLGLLYGMSSSLLLQEQPGEFIDRLFNQLSHHLQLEVYLNYLIDDQGQKLRLIACHGILAPLALPKEWLELGEGICGTAALQRQAIVLEDVQHASDPKAETIQVLGLTAYACYPLLSRGHLLGTFSFGTRNRPGFHQDELALMQVMCDQVAAALERSRLLTDLQRQTEELTQANRMKDEFLSVLSHELRTPLNSMMGWTKLLRTRKMDEKTAARALETLDRNTHSLAQLIEDILDISRVITGKLLLNPINLDLVSLIGTAIQTMQPIAEAKEIRIQTKFEVESVPFLGDANRLQQVLWNLLSNAIKFTPNGGQVTIGIRQQDQIVLWVSDTGRGIGAEFLPHVFDRFRQADSSTTRAYGGLGLGLAIVRHLVELHGGTIHAESLGEGQGATFTLILPLPGQSAIAES